MDDNLCYIFNVWWKLQVHISSHKIKQNQRHQILLGVRPTLVLVLTYSATYLTHILNMHAYMHGYILLRVSESSTMWSSVILSTDFHLRQNSSSYYFNVYVTTVHVTHRALLLYMRIQWSAASNTNRLGWDAGSYEMSWHVPT